MFSAESEDKLWKAMPKHSPLALKAGPALDDVLIAPAMLSLNGIILYHPYKTLIVILILMLSFMSSWWAECVMIWVFYILLSSEKDHPCSFHQRSSSDPSQFHQGQCILLCRLVALTYYLHDFTCTNKWENILAELHGISSGDPWNILKSFIFCGWRMLERGLHCCHC